MDIKDLVHYIVCLASNRGEKLTTLRLVKFLYLIDLYTARENSGETLTGWPWAFVHFGPFCQESLEAINSAAKAGLINPESFESKYEDKDYQLYSCQESSPTIEGKLSIYVSSALKRAIKKWADDTPGLLDYVYFETEPMIPAKPSERLDFTTARKPEKEQILEMKSLSKKQLQKGREAVQRLVKQLKERVIVLEDEKIEKDQEIEKWLRALDGEDIAPGLKGIAKINND